jgi:lipopolysaccharide/colanic/teichoic acid biosynthesis glycosyltransferase
MAQTYIPQYKSELGQNTPDFFLRLDEASRRLLDIFAAAVGLLFLAPLFFLVGILIKRDSPGPVFYRGRRVGKDGREFKILKFRTMYETPTSYAGPKITADGDVRITRLGHWLRDTKLNELPQLWNVLVGEMSLVGPRPEDPEIAARWPAQMRTDLLSVRPGLTSPASIAYRDEEKMLSGGDLLGDYFHDILPSKLRLDRLYLRQRTLLSDIDVIFMTAVVLLPSLHNRPMPEHMLYWGPISRIVSRVGIWLVLDWVVALVATWIAGVFWRMLGPLDVGVGESFLISIGIAVLFSLTNQVLGLNNISWTRAGFLDGIWVMVSGGVGTLAFTLIDRLIFGQHLFPTGMILVAGALATVFFGITRYRERVITSIASRWIGSRKTAMSVGERVLIIGAGELGSWATWLFTRKDFSRAFSIAGIVDDNPRKVGLVSGGVKVLGTTADIPALVKKMDIGVIVFAINSIERHERERIVRLCKQHEIKLVMLPDVMELLRSSMLPDEQALTDAAARLEEAGVTNRLSVDDISSWMDEIDHRLADHDVYAARALLAEMKLQYNSNRSAL